MYEMASDPQYKDELGKQEIDRQHHTIPNQRSQRPKDKHCGNVYNRLWNLTHISIQFCFVKCKESYFILGNEVL